MVKDVVLWCKTLICVWGVVLVLSGKALNSMGNRVGRIGGQSSGGNRRGDRGSGTVHTFHCTVMVEEVVVKVSVSHMPL